ncbi:hypothetical protein CR513_17046, partial [Mucuna pruriens]
MHHFFERCLVCKIAKSKVSSNGLYTSLLIPTFRGGRDPIFTMIDIFSKMDHFIPCQKVIKHKDLYLRDDDFKEAYELYANSLNRCFFRHEGILFKEKRFCVPKISIRELLVKKAHEGDLMGHFGNCKTVRPYMSIFTGLT